MTNGNIWPNLRIANGLSRDMAMAYIVDIGAGGALVQNDPDMAIMLAASGRTVIYRQSGDDGQDNPFQYSAKQFFQKRIHPGFDQFKQRIVIACTNEIDPSVQVDKFNLAFSDAAHDAGYCAALFNHSTNKTRSQWEIHRKTLKECLPRGDWSCFHLYDTLHNLDGAYGWRRLYDDLGGRWGCTEINYIRGLDDAYHGPINAPGLDDQKLRDMWLKHASELSALGIVLFPFSLDDWPANAEGKQSGFGYYNNDMLKRYFMFLNSVYKVKVMPPIVTTIPKPTTHPTKVVIDTLPGVMNRNVRTQPGATDPTSDLGDVRVGDTLDLFLESPQSGWFYVILPSGVEGWVLWNGITYHPVVQNASKYVIRDVDLNTLKGLSLTLQHIREQVETAKDQIDAIIKGAKPSSSGGGF